MDGRELRRDHTSVEYLSLMRTLMVGFVKHGTISDRRSLKRWVFNVCPGAVVYTVRLLLFQLPGWLCCEYLLLNPLHSQVNEGLMSSCAVTLVEWHINVRCWSCTSAYCSQETFYVGNTLTSVYVYGLCFIHAMSAYTQWNHRYLMYLWLKSLSVSHRCFKSIAA